MKTRAEIYGREAAGLIRIISLYPGLSEEMLCRFYPEREEKIPAVLLSLQKQGRVSIDSRGNYLSGGDYGISAAGVDSGLNRAVWVLLDFIDRIEYHSAGEFPVKVIFFADGELYEIIYVAKGQEALVMHVLHQRRENDGKKIMLVDETAQIMRIEAIRQKRMEISGFCTVDMAGKVKYYQKS